MITLLYKSQAIKLTGLSLAAFLVACTNNQSYKRQVSGYESYLNTPPLKKLTVPKGISLPVQNDEYDIPSVNQNGAVGKALDIRPPVQVFLLLSDTHTESNPTASRLFLSKTTKNTVLWLEIKNILQQKKINFIQKNDSDHSLITDWITWQRGDENIPLQTRHRIQLAIKNNPIVITVTNEGIKQGKESINSSLEIQRYNILMLNELIISINKLRSNVTSSNYNNVSA